jgi:hypothetical protein
MKSTAFKDFAGTLHQAQLVLTLQPKLCVITTKFVRNIQLPYDRLDWTGYDAVHRPASGVLCASLRSIKNRNNEMQISESRSYGIRTESAKRYLGHMEKSTYGLTQNIFYFISMWLKIAIAQ